jgi:hypothetical protein
MKRLLPLVVLLLWPRAAAATPYIDPWNGGMVFVGPTSPHVAAVYWNPAALGLMRGTHVWLAAHASYSHIGIDRAEFDPATGEPGTGVDFPKDTETVIKPGAFLGATFDLGNDKIGVGVALHLPYRDEQPQDPDAQYRYHTEGGSLRAYMATLAVSYRVNYRLIFGGGASLMFTRGSFRFALDENLASCGVTTGCLPDRPIEDPEAATHLALDVSSGFTPAFAFNVGVLYRLVPNVWLALVGHSAPGLGLIALTGEARVAPAISSGHGAASGDAQVNLHLPMSLQAGLRWDLSTAGAQLLASVRWIDTSVISKLDMRLAGAELREAEVPEWMYRYQGVSDAIIAELGFETAPGSSWRFGVRGTFDSGGVARTHISPAHVDGPTLGVQAGVELGLGGGFSITLAASAGFMFPRHVTDSVFRPSDQLGCVASDYDLDTCATTRDGAAIPSAAGDYDRFTLGALVGLAWDRL